jgi:hypothetical protein
MVAKSTMDFPPGAGAGEDRQLNALCREVCRVFEIKTGAAEAYALFLFLKDAVSEEQSLHTYLPAIPYIVQFFNYVNDLFSFYKGPDER